MKIVILSFAMVLLVHCTLNIKECSAQWEPDVRLTNNPYESILSMNNAWCVASADANVHVVWEDRRDENPEIYYKRSLDNGTTWSQDIRLTNNTSNSQYPAIAVCGSSVHVVWRDFRDGNAEVYYKRSLDNGTTWSEDINLNNNPNHVEYPSIAVSGSNVHVVWMDYRDESFPSHGEIYYKGSLDNGSTWGADTRLTNDPEVSWYPSIAASLSNVHVSWYDMRDGNSEIYYKHSLDNGINWSQDFKLTNNNNDSYCPSIAVSGSNVHLIWRDSRDGNDEIYYNRSLDNGSSWGTDTRLTDQGAESWLPSIAVSGECVHLVWMDRRNSGDEEIYYKHSLDNGSTWGSDIRLTDTIRLSSTPSIAVSGSYAHVVWEDQRHSNNYGEIYYKRNPSANSNVLIFNHNGLNKTIQDNQSTYDTITVTYDRFTGYIADVNVLIDTVLHTNVADLELYLMHQGLIDTVVYLIEGNGENMIGMILDDGASTPVLNGTAPFTGSYKPVKPLSQFVNLDPTGNWILRVYDKTAGNTGTLKAWGLEVNVSGFPLGIHNFNVIPDKYTLLQNHPNPFSRTTVISWQLPVGSRQLTAGCHVTLKVFDFMGKEIRTLIDGEMMPGDHQVTFDASGLPSGIYFYRLQADGVLETRKMIVLK